MGVGGVARVAYAAEGLDTEERETGAALHEVYRDRQLRIVSNEAVTKPQAKALAARIEKAWASDARQQRWDDVGPLQKTLTVAVLSKGAFSRLTGDTSGAIAGVTTGPDLFVVPDRVLGRTSRQDEDTIAHELAHVQDLRQAGRASDDVPIFIQEGKAYLLGEAYGRDARHLRYIAQVMKQLSADDVATVLAHFRDGRDEQRPPNFVFYGEVTGAMFVEYLATHVKRDAIARLADAVEASGDGVSFATAFRQAFGMSLRDAEARFVDFVRATEGAPSRRLAGTIYDGW